MSTRRADCMLTPINECTKGWGTCWAKPMEPRHILHVCHASIVSWYGLSCACIEPVLQHIAAQARLWHGVNLLGRSLEGGLGKDVRVPCRTRHTVLHIDVHAKLCPEGGRFCAGAMEENQGRPPQALHHDRCRIARLSLEAERRPTALARTPQRRSPERTRCKSKHLKVARRQRTAWKASKPHRNRSARLGRLAGYGCTAGHFSLCQDHEATALSHSHLLWQDYPLQSPSATVHLIPYYTVEPGIHTQLVSIITCLLTSSCT